MHRAVFRGAGSACLALTLSTSIPAADARPVRVHVFNATPETSYQVRLNGVNHTDTYSGPAGAFAVGMEALDGDVVLIAPGQNPDLQPPAPPVFTSVESNGPGCARASWIPSGDPTVTGYVISYGRESVAGGEASQYDHTVTVGTAAAGDVCALAQGLHYFAVQCRNYAGMVSAYSAERSVNVVTVSVLFAMFEARPGAEGVVLAWRVEADEIVRGYRVYRTGSDGLERSLAAALIDPASSSFVDRSAGAGETYLYQVAAVRENGEETRSVALSVETPALALALGQNVPNPFNPATTIPFVLDATARVRVHVYDIRGAAVATLFDDVLPEGRHEIAWDGRDASGRAVASGTYLYRLAAGNQRLSRKMVMVR